MERTNDLFEMVKIGLPIITFVGLVVGWFTQGVKIAEKAKSAPTKEELHEEVRKAEDKVMTAIQPIKDSTIRIEERVDWIVKTLDKGGK